MACIKQKEGRYVLDYYDQQNHRNRQVLPEGTTKKRAQNKLAEIVTQLERGNFVSRKSTKTFKEVAGDWLKVKAGAVRHTTHGTYGKMLSLYILPFMGNMPINKVTVSVVDKFIPYVKAEYPINRVIWNAQGRYRNNKNLHKKYPTLAAYIAHRKTQPYNKEAIPAPASFKKMLDVIGGVMKFAVKRRMVEYNPVSLVERPKLKKTREADFMQPHEIRAMLDNALEGKYKTLFLIAVFTGLRQGELLGLKWDDVDWFNKQVCVNRTYNHGKFMEPKSKTSCRRVDLAPVVIEELKKWKLQCPKSEHTLVFPNDAGEPMDADNMLTRGYDPALRRAKLRHICFHSLRHTYASLQIDNDVNMKYLQAQMGHSSINVTMDVYGHLLKATNQDAAVKLENSIFATVQPAIAAQV